MPKSAYLFVLCDFFSNFQDAYPVYRQDKWLTENCEMHCFQLDTLAGSDKQKVFHK